MQAVLQQTWDLILPDLEAKAGKAAYEAWLSGLRPLALERGVCYLEGKNRLVCDRVQRLFTPLLESCLSAGFGTRITVRLTASAESILPEALEVGPTHPVLDESNETAFLVLQAQVAGKVLPSQLFFFHGPGGVGKSYLLRWWMDAGRERPRLYDGEGLVAALQAACRERRLAGLRQELLADRPLAIDGVHRLGSKKKLQQEFLYILKQRIELDAPIVLTSRWHPREIWGLCPGLESIFLSGFVAPMGLPTHAARLQYLRALCGTASRNGRAMAVESMAREVQGSYQDLRQAFALARHGLEQRSPEYLRLIDPGAVFRRLLARVVERLRVPAVEILGKGQARRISLARQILAWLCVQEGLSQAEVGRSMRGRSRAAISYCIKTLEKRMAESVEIRQKVEGLL